MKCPKCSYVSYDYLDACRKCSVDLVEFKKAIRLEVIRPGELDLGVMVTGLSEKMGHAASFHMDDDFFSAQTMLVDREEVADEGEEEFDFSLDDDLPEAASQARPPAETAESDDFVSFEVEEEEDMPLRSWSTESPRPPASPVTPVDMIDMSDLEDLDDIRIDLAEDSSPAETTAPEEDTWMMSPAPELVVDRPSEGESADLTLDLSEPDMADVPPSVAPRQPVADLATDDILEAELVLDLEEGEAQKPAEPEADLLIDLDELELGDDEEDDRPKPS